MLVEVQLKDNSFIIIESSNISSVKASSTKTIETSNYGSFNGVANMSDQNGSFTVKMIGGDTHELSYAGFQTLREACLSPKMTWDPDSWMWSKDAYGRPIWGPNKFDFEKRDYRREPYDGIGRFIPKEDKTK